MHLKHVIENSYDVPVQKQVLLISGGECLEDEAKICIYPAGTDTNPIFLFNRAFLDGSNTPLLIPDVKSNLMSGKCFDFYSFRGIDEIKANSLVLNEHDMSHAS